MIQLLSNCTFLAPAQACLLSLLPLADSQPGPPTLARLRRVLSWMHGDAFQVTSQPVGCPHLSLPWQKDTPGSDDALDAALLVARRGVAAVVDQLQEAAERRQGSVEQVNALLVALLRALGFAARSVRALHPFALHPREPWRSESAAALLERRAGPRSMRAAPQEPEQKPTRRKKRQASAAVKAQEVACAEDLPTSSSPNKSSDKRPGIAATRS